MGTPAGGMGSVVTSTHTPLSTVERELKAAEQNEKKALALIANPLDTQDVSFVEQRVYRYENQNPSRPKLSHPMHSLRVATEGGFAPDSGWQSHYDNLVENLPPDVKAWFQEQMQLSYLARDPDYYAFDAVLVITAMTIAWLEGIIGPLPPESGAYSRAEYNLLIPYIAIHTFLTEGSSIMTSGQLLLYDLGPNHPLFDTLFKYHEEISAAMDELKEIVKDLGKDPPPPDAKQRLATLLRDVQRLVEQYQYTTPGNEFLILGAIIGSLALVTESLSLGFGPASLLWLSSLALIGGTTDESSAGIIGPNVQKLVESLSEGVVGLILNADVSNRALISFSLYVMLILSTATALGIAESGINTLPPTHPHDQAQARYSTLDLAFHMLLSAGVYRNQYSTIAELNGADEQTQKIIADCLTLCTLVVVMLALSGNEDVSQDFFESFSDEMLPMVDTAIATLENIDTSSDPRLSALSLSLQQAKIALEGNDYAGFCDACQGCAKALGIDPALLNDEVQSFHHLGGLVMQAFSLSPEDQAHLTTVQSA